MEKNNSGNSGERKITPENENLSPYFDVLSPDKEEYLSTKPDVTRVIGYTGDNFDIVVEKEKYLESGITDSDLEGTLYAYRNLRENYEFRRYNEAGKFFIGDGCKEKIWKSQIQGLFRI